MKENIRLHSRFYTLISLITLAGIPILIELAKDWIDDGNYSHGFLIIPISIYLFIRSSRGFKFPAKPSKPGLIVFLFGCSGFIIGAAASEYFISRVSLLLMVFGVSLYYLGGDNMKKGWFAFFYLIFMIPPPAIIYYSVTLPMQLFASKITSMVLGLSGIPAVRQGNIIFLSGYTLEVTEACSGLRSLVSLMALTAVVAALWTRGRIRKVVLFLGAVPIAIAANIFRLLVTGMGALTFGPAFAEIFLHELSGIIVFASAFIAVIILGAALNWIKSPS